MNAEVRLLMTILRVLSLALMVESVCLASETSAGKPPQKAATKAVRRDQPQVPAQSRREPPLGGELELAAAVVCAEARGEGRHGMEAVWEVIWERKNRAEGRRTLTAVLTRPAHFTCLNRTSPAVLIAKMRRTGQWKTAVELVKKPPMTRHVRGADHFTRSDERPYWTRGHKPVSVVGNHAFYRLGV